MGGREGGNEGGREAGRDGWREGGREGGMKDEYGGKVGIREYTVPYMRLL